MRPITGFLAVCVLLLTFAGTARAAVNATTGAINFTGNQLAEWNVDVDFGATAASYPVTITCGFTEVASGFRLEMYDLTRVARAATTAAWNAGMPIWDTGAPAAVAAGTYNLEITTGVPYQTLSLSGVHRFVFAISPSDGTLALNNNITVTFAIAGAPVASGTPGFHNWTTRPAGGGLGTLGSSNFFQRNYNGNALLFTNINNAADSVQYEFDVDFGATAVSKAVSIWAFAFGTSTGSGNLHVRVHALGQGFQNPPDAEFSIAVSAEGVATFNTVPLSGVQKFRVVFEAGTGFTATFETIGFFTVESGVTLADALINPVLGAAPITIVPGSTAFSSSPANLTCSGGTGAPSTYNWTIQGTVPTGVSLSSATGASTNIIFNATTPAASMVTVRATNGAGPEYAEESYTLNFGGGGGGTLTIDTITLPNGTVGGSYSGNLTASGTAVGPFTWSVSAGALPGGVTLGGSATLNETLAGTPSAAGTFTFDLTISNGSVSDSQSYQVDIVAAGVLIITTTTLSPGTNGTLYAGGTINSVGGLGNHTWSLTAGVLPTGLALGTGPGASTAITGTPTQTGSFPLTVQVVDTSGIPQTDTQAFTLVINAPGGGPGPGGLGGGGGGGGGGCAADSNAPWMLAIGLLGLFGFALRMRSRKA